MTALVEDPALVRTLRKLAAEDPTYSVFARSIRSMDDLHRLRREVEDEPDLCRIVDIVIRRVTSEAA